jgi:hypothetical protein
MQWSFKYRTSVILTLVVVFLLSISGAQTLNHNLMVLSHIFLILIDFNPTFRRSEHGQTRMFSQNPDFFSNIYPHKTNNVTGIQCKHGSFCSPFPFQAIQSLFHIKGFVNGKYASLRPRLTEVDLIKGKGFTKY